MTVRLWRILGCAALLAAPAAAQFPPISEAERALTAVPWDRDAPAVVLFHRGTFVLEPRGKQTDSLFTVAVRIKVLREEGLRWGQIELDHASSVRLRRLVGRTVLPDGRVLELGEDDVFRRRASQAEKRFVTTAALPGVEVGAIIDYEYELVIGSIFTFRPWLFQNAIPTLSSEISYEVPEHIGFRPWSRTIPGKLELTTENRPRGRIVRARMENLPSLPEEPFAYPPNDLANQFFIVPTQYVLSGTLIDLLVSWEKACELVRDGYSAHQRKNGDAKRQARQLAASASGVREQAAAIFRFVRDEIQLEPLYGVFARQGTTVDEVLRDRRGDFVDQALVLQAMLDAVKIESDLVWVADRSGGRIDTETPNPGWFDRAVVRLEIAGETLFLDPSDGRLAFGQLPPGLEGTQALLVHRRKPQILTLPTTPHSDHRRVARLDLAVDEAGRVAGRGELVLSGHHAWRQMGRDGDHWQGWLEARLGDFEIDEIDAEEHLEERRLVVRWTMAQPLEEVLGDEAVLDVARPLGPVEQPFKSLSRRSPALLPFADREELEVVLTWPEGWEVDVAPRGWDFSGPAGSLVAAVTLDAGARRIHCSRRLDISQREFTDSSELGALRALYAEAERHDAQQLVLARR